MCVETKYWIALVAALVDIPIAIICWRAIRHGVTCRLVELVELVDEKRKKEERIADRIFYH